MNTQHPTVATFRAASSSSEPYQAGHHLVEDNTFYGLIDGGATNPLREGESSELESATPVMVQLATGEAELWMSRTGVILANFPVLPIVPMGVLTNELHCEVHWQGGECRVYHPTRGWLHVTMLDNCPHLSRQETLSLITEVENVRAMRILQAARLRIINEKRHTPFEEAYKQLRDITQEGILDNNVDKWVGDIDGALFTCMSALFSDMPETQLLEALQPADFDMVLQVQVESEIAALSRAFTRCFVAHRLWSAGLGAEAEI